MTLSEELEKARAESDAARKRMQSLDEKYFQQVLRPKMRRRIGECFRTRNTYGSGEPWWLYVRIVDVDESSFVTLNLERDCNGKIEIERGFIFGMEGQVDARFQKITPREFHKQAVKIFREAQKLAGLN